MLRHNTRPRSAYFVRGLNCPHPDVRPLQAPDLLIVMARSKKRATLNYWAKPFPVGSLSFKYDAILIALSPLTL